MKRLLWMDFNINMKFESLCVQRSDVSKLFSIIINVHLISILFFTKFVYYNHQAPLLKHTYQAIYLTCLEVLSWSSNHPNLIANVMLLIVKSRISTWTSDVWATYDLLHFDMHICFWFFWLDGCFQLKTYLLGFWERGTIVLAKW